MILKQHLSQGKSVLAICDKELLGKKIEEGESILDLSSEFYKGDRLEKTEILDLLERAYMINGIGKKTIRMLIEKGLLKEEGIKTIGGIPYTLIVSG